MTAVAGTKKGGGGGLAALAILGVVFCWPTGQRVSMKGGGPELTRYHVLRFWGTDPRPTRGVVETELERAAREHGVPVWLFRAVVKAESAFNHRAVSPVGARGLGQVMPANARHCGLKTADELYDPVKNLRCSARLLSENLRAFGGDIGHALMAYNWGSGRVEQWVKAGRPPHKVPAETKNYVAAILRQGQVG